MPSQLGGHASRHLRSMRTCPSAGDRRPRSHGELTEPIHTARRERRVASPRRRGRRPLLAASRWLRLVGGLVDCIVYASVVFAWQVALTFPTSIAWLLFMGPVYFATTSVPL